jgi:CRP/FNR family cyclic AMP-dependent transcriptional regulator
MTFRSLDLKAIPLFANLPDAHLEQLVRAFERHRVAAGVELFRPGAVADRFLLLLEGEVEVRWGDERIAVQPFAPVGELAALAGLHRATSALTTVDCELLGVPRARLLAFFEENGDIGFRFHQNLMHLLADKIERDRRRLDEMKSNLIETQKAMKRMRDALLDADDTPLHRTMFEELDAHIEHNRRGRYQVEVPRALPIRLRIDGEREVLRISNERLLVALGPGAPLAAGAVVTAVLAAAGTEIPVSGTVLALHDEGVALALDPLIEEYAAELERLLARLQLLDVVF